MAVDFDYDQLFPGRFIKSGEFKGRECTLTISDIKLEDMEDRKGMKTKCIVSFAGKKKQLVLNKTNGECIKGMFGRKVADWIGKRVTFYPETVSAFGSQTLAIRVKGSPDIPADRQIQCKIGRDTVTVTMKRTGAPAANAKPAPNQAPPPRSSPPTDPMHDPAAEPPDDFDQTTGELSV